MITKNDLLILLTDLQGKGIDTTQQLNEALTSNNISLNVLKFINDNRQLDVSAFYDRMRKSYNQGHSRLYGNIVKEDFSDPSKILTTISSLLNQILLFAQNNATDRQMFLKHARADELTKVLYNYLTTWDITRGIKALQLVKADLKAFESIK